MSTSEIFVNTLPPCPLRGQLVGLHALLLVQGTRGDGLAIAEHYLREIAVFTQIDPRFPHHRGGWQAAIDWLVEYGNDRPSAELVDDMRTRFPG